MRSSSTNLPGWLDNLAENFDFPAARTAKLFPGGPVAVPRQVKYMGDARVIPNDLADKCSADMGINGVLNELNVLLETRYTVDTPSLFNLLQPYVIDGADFGTVYGQLRGWWTDFLPNNFFPDLASLLDYFKNQDQEKRDSSIKEDMITSSSLPPRRIWDLYSNRVVPYWTVVDRGKGLPPEWHTDTPTRQIWPISHSWAPENDRQYVLTRINGQQWPVPIPSGVSLEHVRIELLNLGAEYVWLDVLCLRQVGASDMEGQRLEEWRLDVPTIGYVYSKASQLSTHYMRLNPRIVIYFSGLGRPFVAEDLENSRHWLNRAWTLQETPGIRSYNRDLPKIDIIGGWTPMSPKRRHRQNKQPQPEVERQFFRRLDSITIRGDIIAILHNMRRRYSVNPVDKIAGLAYLLAAHQLPIYSPNEDTEHVWQRLLDVISVEERGVLLFIYPCAGEGPRISTPSWDQVLTGPELPGNDPSLGPWARVSVGKDGLFYMNGGYFKSVCLSGFGDPGTRAVRKGTFSVRTDENGTEIHTFEAFAPEWHKELIPDGEGYCLVASRNFQHWVVCTEVSGSENLIRKVSVLQTAVFHYQSQEDYDRIMNFRGLCRRGILRFV